MNVTAKDGFTLLELMVAVTIAVILLSSIYGIFASVSGTRERLTRDGEGYHKARIFYDRLCREVRSAYLAVPPAGTGAVSQGPTDTLFRGGINEDANPYLDLTTTVSSPLVGGKSGGIALVRYELTEEDEEGEGQVLLRTERPLNGDPDAEQRAYRLITGVKELGFAFFRNGEWFEDWDSAQQQGLPWMIRVRMEIEVDGVTIPFVTTVEPAMAR